MIDLEEAKHLLKEVIEGMDDAEGVSQSCYVGTYWRDNARQKTVDVLAKLENMEEGDDWSITDEKLLKCTDKELRVIINAVSRELQYLLLQYECDQCGHRAEKIPKPCPECGLPKKEEKPPDEKPEKEGK